MNIGRWTLLLFGAGLLAAAFGSASACKNEPVGPEPPTTTTTSPTGSGGCDVNLVALLGATEQCEACVGEYCCAEARAFATAQDTETAIELVGCAVNDGEGPCTDTCTVRVCEGDLVYQFLMRCGDCVNSYCCDVWSPCEEDETCLESCILDPNPTITPSCCEQGSLYPALDQCRGEICVNVCGPPRCEAGGAGGGGTGGAGAGGSGAGGSAASGGAGASGA